MTHNPDFSVVIVNWDGKADLAHCLASLAQQTFRSFETIVVDNGSTDGSVEMVRHDHPQVQLIALPENTGFSVANNLAIEKARGRYIALLNNDAFPQLDWLEHLYRALENYPQVGFCASKVLRCPEGEVIDSVGDTFSIVGRALKLGSGQRDRGQFEGPRFVFGAAAAAAAYRRSMLKEIGLFDEDFSPANLEDVDLSFRAQLAGYRCLYVPQAVAHHRVSATLQRRSAESFYLHVRNSEYVFWKDMPMLLLLALMPLHALYILGGLVYHASGRRTALFLRAKRDAFRHLPRTLKKRREIQRRRRVSLRYVVSILDAHVLGTLGRILNRSGAGT
jgi:hypothetical protein